MRAEDFCFTFIASLRLSGGIPQDFPAFGTPDLANFITAVLANPSRK
jgi:hypothetical protein